MEYDRQRVQDAVLALLHLTSFKDDETVRAWKSHDWDTMDELCEAGMIFDPKRKAKSVVLTEEGVKRSTELFRRMFASGAGDARS
ncbi:MAG: DUF6429 family protein [Planctomycetota bacterium]|jgi:hypothetical protein